MIATPSPTPYSEQMESRDVLCDQVASNQNHPLPLMLALSAHYTLRQGMQSYYLQTLGFSQTKEVRAASPSAYDV